MKAKSTLRSISEYKAKVKERRTTALSDEEMKKVYSSFYKFAREFGFYINMKEAIKTQQFYIIKPQQEIIEHMLDGVFQKKPYRLNVSIPRQIGKTEIITMVFAFIFDNYYPIFGEPFMAAVIAPEKGTASSVFQRVVNRLHENNVPLDVDRAAYKRTMRGDIIELFGIFEDKTGGTIEGRTYNLVVRDEAHMGDDEKYKDQILPTLARTNGMSVMIGNGGFERKYFLECLEKGNTEETILTIRDEEGNITDERKAYNIVVRYVYHDKEGNGGLKKYFLELGKLGVPKTTDWVAMVEGSIAEQGLDNHLIRKNYFCEWSTGELTWLTENEIKGCHKSKTWSRLRGSEMPVLVAGLDMALAGDRSVCTIMGLDRHIYDWLVIKRAGERKTAMQQMEDLIHTLESKGYLDYIAHIGLDATGGYGHSAHEILDRELDCELIEYHFNNVRKRHIWYSSVRELITSNRPKDRITVDPNHIHYPIFLKECTSLVVKPRADGTAAYAAPSGRRNFDDFVAATAIANDVRANVSGYYADGLERAIDSDAQRRKRFHESIIQDETPGTALYSEYSA